MRVKLLLAFLSAAVMLLSAAPPCVASSIYATVYDYTDTNNHLIQIDVTSGAVTDIGAVTVVGQEDYKPGLPGLSWHTDGYLYASDTYGNQILKIDRFTALAEVVTGVGAELGGYMFGLAIEADGTYYLTDWELRVGTLPGPTVLVGLGGISDTDSCDLAPDGTLWATDSQALLTIDKTTGAQSLVRSWTGVDIAGIAIDGPIAWAIDRGDGGSGNQWLVTIDLGTGDLTYTHPLPDGYYLATAIPEPATAGLLALGLAALAHHRHRRRSSQKSH